MLKMIQEKAYFVTRQLENCIWFDFGAIMFADFEYKLHAHDGENNEHYHQKLITDLYADLTKNIMEKDVTMDELIWLVMLLCTTFLYDYYVYKYTLGMTVALAIVDNRI